MRKIFNLAIVVLLSLGATSCVKDAIVDDGGNDITNGNKLAFNFEGINDGVTTYATVAAEAFEKTVTDATVYIFEYAADQSGTLLLVQNEDFTSSSDYLVIVDDATNALVGKQLVAYFTINNGAGFNTHADLTTFTAGSGKTEADFAAVATDAITDKVNRTGFLMSGAITDDFVNSGEYPVSVKRRVARFDIRNELPATITDVTKITIRKAMNLGNVFGDATVAASATALTTDVVYDLTASEYGANGTSALVWVEGFASSVFYLNPTVLKAISNSSTEIFVEATVGGETKVFEVSLTSDIDIQANYRYILTLGADLRFRITVEDWEASEEIPTQIVTPETFGLAAAPTAIGATYNAGVFASTAAGSTLKFTMMASSSLGSTYSLTPETLTDYETYDGTKITVNITNETTVTYAAPYFSSKFEVTVDPIDIEKSFSTILTVTDNKSGESVDFRIYFYGTSNAIHSLKYPIAGGGELDPVVIGGVIWAPVNVGAVNVATEDYTDLTNMRLPENCGYFFQWGRNDSKFRCQNDTGYIYRDGPLSYEEATGTYKSNFIIGEQWLSYDDPNYDIVSEAWANGTDTPCPQGWRIPTVDELAILENAYLNSGTNRTFSILIPNDFGDRSLVLPLSSFKKREDGYISSQLGKNAYLWSSTQSGRETNGKYSGAYYLRINAETADAATYGYRKATGIPIRCVKNIE